MRVSVIPAADLPADLHALWSDFQLADDALANPHFRPEFTMLVASIRPDVFVAVLEDDEVVGFLPFQRDRLKVGWPVGGMMSDYQGVIARPGAEWDAVGLIKGAGLVAWQFDKLLVEQAPFAAYHRSVAGSPFMDLSQGFAAYAASRRSAGSRQVKNVLYLSRKLEREVGPVRFEPKTSDATVLAALLRWKDEHHARTERENVLRLPWITDLLEGIFRAEGAAFSGMLSALYAGDDLIAAHLGMRSRTDWHYYVTSFDRRLARYSPGLIMLVAMAQAAESLGIRVIDLGKGDALYKERLATGATAIAEGAVEVPSAAGTMRHIRQSAREALRRSPLATPLRAVTRAARRRGWLRD